MAAVEISNVTKTYGAQVAVDQLSLAVPEGSVYGFIGPNGSGKTTTIRMIMRIIAPDRGTIRVLGDESTAHGPANDRIGYLPEERGLYKQMKVREVLRFYSEIKGHRPTNAEITDWLDRMGLPGVAEKKVEALSKGMSQKVQFIATIIAKPQLVILDEPFSGLDPGNAEVMREMVLSLKKEGRTVIFSTHDMGVAEEMCDFVFMIYKGKKVLDGTLASIQHQHGTDVLQVRFEQSNGHGRPSFDNLPGVKSVTDLGNSQELRLTTDCDRQALLQEMMRRGRIERFDIAHPSLHDIFLRIVKEDRGVLADA